MAAAVYDFIWCSRAIFITLDLMLLLGFFFSQNNVCVRNGPGSGREATLSACGNQSSARGRLSVTGERGREKKEGKGFWLFG
jgi:hypothetical protein